MDSINSVPDYLRFAIGSATIRAMRRTQTEHPELWAKIKARSAELKAQEEPDEGKEKPAR